jgi:predicted transcriptional regulator
VTGNQLRKIIRGLGISQAALAKDIGISDRQMRRYCAMGKAHIPVVVECAVMWVSAGSRDGHEERIKDK